MKLRAKISFQKSTVISFVL